MITLPWLSVLLMGNLTSKVYPIKYDLGNYKEKAMRYADIKRSKLIIGTFIISK